MSIDNEWQKFILDESIEDKTIFTYLQGLKEIISNFKPKTVTDKRRITLAKSQLQEIRKYAKRMENQIYTLKEQLVILEESKDIE
tara:strand:- start:112 stop:366 length:255 start_codon:yes stop_codon:yes gene_type:complete